MFLVKRIYCITKSSDILQSLSIPASICRPAYFVIYWVRFCFKITGLGFVRSHRHVCPLPPSKAMPPTRSQTGGYQHFPLARSMISKMETKQHPPVSHSKGWKSSVPANHFVVALDALCRPVVNWKSVYRRAFITQQLHLAFWVTMAHTPNQRKALRGSLRTIQKSSEMQGVNARSTET